MQITNICRSKDVEEAGGMHVVLSGRDGEDPNSDPSWAGSCRRLHVGEVLQGPYGPQLWYGGMWGSMHDAPEAGHVTGT